MSLAGIAVGSLLVVTMLGLFGSLTGSVKNLSKLAAGADLEILASTDAGVDGALVPQLRAVPGVLAADPIVRAPIVVNDRTVLLLGADTSANAPVGGIPPTCLRSSDAGAAAARTATPVALGARLARALGAQPGSQVTVFAGGKRTTASVFGILDCDEAGVLNNGMFVATTLRFSDALTARGGRVDSIFVRAAPGTSPADLAARIRPIVGGQAVVASPELRVKLAEKGMKALQQGLTTAISLAFVVAGFLVYNTMSMAALERRRELATLRAIGGRRRSLLVGAAIGSVAGVFAAKAALTKVPTIVLDYLGVRPSFVLPPLAIPTGIALATLTTLVAAYFPARNAVRVPPVDAMRPDGVLEAGGGEGRARPIVLAAGIALFVFGNIATVFGHGDMIMTGFGAITIGTVVATAGVTGGLARVVGRLATGFGATGRLAAAGIERSPRRVWSTTLAVTIAVGVVIALGGIVRNQEQSFGTDFESLAKTDLWVQATTPDTVPSQPVLPKEWVPAIAALPGVAAVMRDQAAYMTLGDEQLLLEGMETGTNVPFYRLAGPAADAVLGGDGILVSKAWADRHGLGVGGLFSIPTPSGPHDVRVAAVVDLPVIVQGQMGIDYDRFTQWFGRNALSGIEIRLAPGADRAQVRDAVRAITAAAPIPINVFTGPEVKAGSMESLRQSLALFNLMIWVVVGATGLAILNTMAISVVERRRELGILRAVGTSRRTIQRMVVAEAAAITAAGAVIGTAMGLVQHRVGIEAIAGLVGFGVDYHFVVMPIVIAAGASVVMAVAGSFGPAARAGRVDVIEAIGYE
jgi:putative ABC transport system permease protein